MVKTNATRILIETIVLQTIKGIKDNPERGIRRFVDMVDLRHRIPTKYSHSLSAYRAEGHNGPAAVEKMSTISKDFQR